MLHYEPELALSLAVKIIQRDLRLSDLSIVLVGQNQQPIRRCKHHVGIHLERFILNQLLSSHGGSS